MTREYHIQDGPFRIFRFRRMQAAFRLRMVRMKCELAVKCNDCVKTIRGSARRQMLAKSSSPMNTMLRALSSTTQGDS
ncbi:hypothetical protein BAUCODRAFT_38724 [Baudoinia panamericana UAMH 10762]|uniref:Uncharacterized protein n=1 Tax=Baudoinia panamericana (strain UAMH 10762) TaxID=717646 RepID=M2MZ68_BAUPA|nr:uncharacterized protein BAUCODRAFT_38724 [Baudoinia panamericana UAMH 10762]EMC91615.1 hypothetical protein BAUCODRAFT_38724 [Baudoinia panamericana UAMH 10762]